jgi:crotonobetainyl-CoA:carnitine CoA-transferase CaiB-like acyl-CoA transferase
MANGYLEIGGDRAGFRFRAPTLGEHTDDVLTRELGLGSDELAALRSQGVIGVSPLQ